MSCLSSLFLSLFVPPGLLSSCHFLPSFCSSSLLPSLLLPPPLSTSVQPVGGIEVHWQTDLNTHFGSTAIMKDSAVISPPFHHNQPRSSCPILNPIIYFHSLISLFSLYLLLFFPTPLSPYSQFFILRPSLSPFSHLTFTLFSPFLVNPSFPLPSTLLCSPVLPSPLHVSHPIIPLPSKLCTLITQCHLDIWTVGEEEITQDDAGRLSRMNMY